jgi:hypothetical protein
VISMHKCITVRCILSKLHSVRQCWFICGRDSYVQSLTTSNYSSQLLSWKCSARSRRRRWDTYNMSDATGTYQDFCLYNHLQIILHIKLPKHFSRITYWYVCNRCVESAFGCMYKSIVKLSAYECLMHKVSSFQNGATRFSWQTSWL